MCRLFLLEWVILSFISIKEFLPTPLKKEEIFHWKYIFLLLNESGTALSSILKKVSVINNLIQTIPSIKHKDYLGPG